MSANAEEIAGRARDWYRAAHEGVWNEVERWEHGIVTRTPSYPNYWDLSVVRVEDDPSISVDELEAFADSALADFSHRRIDFEVVEAGDRLRPELEARGWKTTRLVWMRHTDAVPEPPDIAVEEVPYEAVHALRVTWHYEDFEGEDPEPLLKQAQEVAQARDVQVLVVSEGGEPISYAQVERREAGAEVTQVYVLPDHRGSGRGTAMTAAAIEAAGDADDIWIVADDDDRAKDMYAKLGFRPAWYSIEFQLSPGARATRDSG